MSNFYKKHKKKAGRCPLCQKELKMPKEDLLKLLELASDAGLITKQMIKDRYKELSKIYHPDKPTGDAEKFQEISEAKEELLDLLSEEDFFNIDPIEQVFSTQQATTATSAPNSKTSQSSTSSASTEKSTSYSDQQPPESRNYNYDQYQQIKQTILNLKKQMRPGIPCPYCKKPI